MMRSTLATPATLCAAALVVGALLSAPAISPHDPASQSPRWLNAPPSRIHIRDTSGTWRRPFIYPLRRVSQLEQHYEDAGSPTPLVWFRSGILLQSAAESDAPLLLLGADSLGRDVFSRLLFGARTSLSLAVLATVLTLTIGGAVGLLAGYKGGAVDDWLMRGADFALLLPGIYIALLLRALLPDVLPAGIVFVLLAAIFAVMGAPLVARGVRGIIRAERERDYVVASISLGADTSRVVTRHLLPATVPFLAVQATLLVPAFVVAEATFSYVGLGFPETTPTWGTMLLEAGSARVLADFPWLLSPVAAIFVVVLAMHLAGRRTHAPQERPLTF